MADDLMTQRDSVAQSTEPVAAPTTTTPSGPLTPHTPLYGIRFGVAYALLAVILGTAAGLAVVLAGDDDAAPSGTWSEWRPQSDGATAQIKEIADFVAQRYRLPSGRQLVGVIPDPLSVQTEEGAVPVSDIAIRSGTTEHDVVKIESADDSWMFTLCGLGDRCVIEEGEPSIERARLLRREVLELALYSFHYVESVKSIIAFMPPRNPRTAGSLVYLRRQDLQRNIEQPLSETLLPLERLTLDDLAPGEADLVDALTDTRLYNYDFRPGPTGGPIMILDPL
jgi:hypothetical protein